MSVDDRRNRFHVAYHLARILKLDSRHRLCRIILSLVLAFLAHEQLSVAWSMEFTLMVNHAVAHHIVFVCFLGIESLLEEHHASTQTTPIYLHSTP